MVQPQKEPLRALNEQEEGELQRVIKASSERVDVMRRAKALLAVAKQDVDSFETGQQAEPERCSLD